MHQARHVLQADIARLQLFVGQDPNAPATLDMVAVEREIHLFDTETLGAHAERGLRAARSAAEQGALVRLHVLVSTGRSIISSTLTADGRVLRPQASMAGIIQQAGSGRGGCFHRRSGRSR
jgi:hypothetical protein